MSDADRPTPAESSPVLQTSDKSPETMRNGETGGAERFDPAAPGQGLRRFLVSAVLVALAFCVVHRLIHPHHVFLQPDAGVMIVAGEALEQDGKLLIPFSRGYPMYPRPFRPIASMTEPEWLQDDTRDVMIHYPPGLSAFTALGIRLGFSPADFLLATFYIQMFINMIAWQVWAGRAGIPRVMSLAATSLFLMYSPTTIPDHYVFALTGILVLLGQQKPGLATFAAASVVIAAGVLFRQHAVVLAAAWCGWWLVKWPGWKTLTCAVISAGAGSGAALLIQRLMSGNTNFLEKTPYHGIIPTAREVFDAVAYYAFQGGWSPEALPLKILAVLSCLATIAGIAWLASRRQLSQWHLQILALIFANALFLSLVQLRYGSEFSTSPIRIARYWGLPMFGCACLQGSMLAFFAGPRRQNAVWVLYSSFLVLCVAQSVYAFERDYARTFRSNADRFARHLLSSRIYDRLQGRDFLAVFGDDNATVFRTYDALRIKRAYSPWFRSRTSGQIAILVAQSTGRPQSRVLAEVCRKELKLVEELSLEDDAHTIQVFELPAEKVIDAREALAATPAKASGSSNERKTSRPLMPID